MFLWNNSNKSRSKKQKANNTAAHYFHSKLDSNIEILKTIFNEDETVIYRRLINRYNNDVRCCIVFIDGMVNNEIVNENIIQPIIANPIIKSRKCLETIQYQIVPSNDVTKTPVVSEVVEAVINGDTAFFLDGSDEALIISSKSWQTRSIEEPQNEKVLRGPREGFTESILTNLSLLRRKLKTPNLKFKPRVLGNRSNTKVYVCYIEGIAHQQILDELNKRLDEINVDGIMDSGYIQELIKDSRFTPFKTIGSTERPDVVAAKLLEGRVALLVDGTPIALTLPNIFIELFQSNEDYYVNFYYASINRFFRYIGFGLSVSLPAIYLALVTYHQELVPTPLLISISAARQGVPFPSSVEAYLLGLVFEILREAGTRMPSYIGQALSIVGALVIGQAAVQARIVSAPIVIVVAMTGITALMLPKLKGAGIVLRFILLSLASVLGLYGLIFGISGLLIHLFQLRSFGVPFMSGLMTVNPDDLKDTAIRSPWWFMKRRPKFIGDKNPVRQAVEKK